MRVNLKKRTLGLELMLLEVLNLKPFPFTTKGVCDVKLGGRE